MSHALIIDDNLIVSRALEDRLVMIGYDTFDRVWTERDALVAAATRKPDLVVVGDHVESGSALRTAERLSRVCEAPILLVTADSTRARQKLPPDAALTGPFKLNEIDRAVAEAQAA